MADRAFIWNQAALRHRETPRRYKPVGPVGERPELVERRNSRGRVISNSDATCVDCGHHVCSCARKYNFPIERGFATGHEQGSYLNSVVRGDASVRAELRKARYGEVAPVDAPDAVSHWLPSDDPERHQRLHDELLARIRAGTDGFVKNGREYTLPGGLPAGKLTLPALPSRPVLLPDIMPPIKVVPNDPKDAELAKVATKVVNHLLANKTITLKLPDDE